MKIGMGWETALPLLLLAVCAPSADHPPENEEHGSQQENWAPAAVLEAVSQLKPTAGGAVEGIVSFRETDGKLQIVAHVAGLLAGRHGLHIHQNGDCSSPETQEPGEHFNPLRSKHGGPTSSEHHVGDLGNIEADGSGVAHLEMTVDFATLSEGPKSVLGLGIMVHSQEDDLQTQPDGGAGLPLACGIIELARPLSSPSEGSGTY